jgi:hypothetical protein
MPVLVAGIDTGWQGFISPVKPLVPPRIEAKSCWFSPTGSSSSWCATPCHIAARRIAAHSAGMKPWTNLVWTDIWAWPPAVDQLGPNDIFEIGSNNSPDLPDEDDEVHEPQDYTGDYPLESDEGDEE